VLQFSSYVFSVALLYPISLTPRFSEVRGRVYYHNRFRGLLVHQQETAETVGLSQESITPSKREVRR